MKEFEVGKTYHVNVVGDKTITVIKRTKRYATVKGDWNGRFYIYRQDLFRLGENLYLPTDWKGGLCFCFAEKEVK